MDIDQLTKISIQINQLGQKVDWTLLAACIGFLGALSAAGVATWTAFRLKGFEKRQQTQWAYLGKTTSLADSAVEVFCRMLFNKILLANKIDVQAAASNLFALHKDALVIESQLVIYGSFDLANAVHDFSDLILKTSNENFISQWHNIYSKGQDYLLLFRSKISEGATEKVEDFEKKLKSDFPLPSLEEVKEGKAASMGSIRPL